MKKTVTLIFITILIFFLCSFTNTKIDTKYKVEVDYLNHSETIYTDDLDNIHPKSIKNIYRYIVFEKDNCNNYNIILDIDLRNTFYDSNNNTHGKAFPWGYQVYFTHEIIEKISSYDDISAGISTVIGALAGIFGPEGIVTGVLIGLFQTDWAIAKRMDKGDGVTLTNVLYISTVHWWNSGNAIRSGWF